MRLAAFIGVLVAALALAAPAWGGPAEGVAALQVALHAKGLDPGPVDGVLGPQTRSALQRFQRQRQLPVSARIDASTRRALGRLGTPLLGRRELWIGLRGWDVSALEFRLRRHGLARARIDGVFDRATARALQNFQLAKGLAADGIAGPKTFAALRVRGGRPSTRPVHTVRPGESFFSIAARYHVSPWLLARENRIRLDGLLVPGQKLRLPGGAVMRAAPAAADKDQIRRLLDHWSAVYGVDPALARALAWMESGFQQHVVSAVGAVGVMQLLPETWEYVDTVLIGRRTQRNAAGNIRAGVRYLRWQLDQFGGNRRLALAGWYQGARAVRERGLFDDTKQFVEIVLALYGKV